MLLYYIILDYSMLYYVRLYYHVNIQHDKVLSDNRSAATQIRTLSTSIDNDNDNTNDIIIIKNNV